MHADINCVTPEPRLDRAQRRREISWFLAGLLTVGALLFGARWWAGLLDHVDPIVAVAAVAGIAGARLASGRRRGFGWSALGVLCGAAIVLVIATAPLVAACI